MTDQGPHQLERSSRPNFNAFISRSRDDELIIEIDSIDCRRVTEQNSTQIDFGWAYQIPNGDAFILEKEATI